MFFCHLLRLFDSKQHATGERISKHIMAGKYVNYDNKCNDGNGGNDT